MALYLVSIIVAILSLGAYAFLSFMSFENEATQLRGDEIQIEHVTQSGMQLVHQMVDQPESVRRQIGGIEENPSFFRGIIVLGPDATGQGYLGPPGVIGRFTVLSPRIERGQVTGLKYGLKSESSRLHLDTLLKWEEASPGSGRKALMQLPGMTTSAADSLLDWIDADKSARPSGAELSYYRRLGLPYGPRNAVPASLEELLLVRDVTRKQLYGTDENLNYLRDEGEEKLDLTNGASDFADEGDGRLPWCHYLTVFSAEKDVDPQGRPRVYLNENQLPFLHQQLRKRVDRSLADFIILYRQFGPAGAAALRQARRQSQQDDSDSSSSSGKSRRTSKQSAPTEASWILPASKASSLLDTSQRARYRLASPLDLIDARVAVKVPEETENTMNRGAASNDDSARQQNAKPKMKTVIVASPLRLRGKDLVEGLAQLLDHTSTSRQTVIPGRINVNEAPRCVLEAIPGFSESTVSRILAMRRRLSDDNPLRRHPTWLLAKKLVDLPTMKRLMPYVTTGGDVYRGQMIGFFDTQGTFNRAEFVVDATVSPPRQVFYKDLTMLGRGYPDAVLQPGPESYGESFSDPLGPMMGAGVVDEDDLFGESVFQDDPYTGDVLSGIGEEEPWEEFPDRARVPEEFPESDASSGSADLPAPFPTMTPSEGEAPVPGPTPSDRPRRARRSNPPSTTRGTTPNPDEPPAPVPAPPPPTPRSSG